MLGGSHDKDLLHLCSECVWVGVGALNILLDNAVRNVVHLQCVGKGVGICPIEVLICGQD